MSYAALLLFALAPIGSVLGQCERIQDRVALSASRGEQRPVEIFRTLELLAISLEETVAAGDLVVEGTVQPIRTYISEDGCRVLTDYAVHVSQAHHGVLRQPTKPGQAAPLTITTYGGEMTVNGIKVVAQLEQLPPFTPGQHVLLILSRKGDGGRVSYQIAHEIRGAFAVENGRVKHLLRSAGSARFDDMDKAALLAKLKRN